MNQEEDNAAPPGDDGIRDNDAFLPDAQSHSSAYNQTWMAAGGRLQPDENDDAEGLDSDFGGTRYNAVYLQAERIQRLAQDPAAAAIRARWEQIIEDLPEMAGEPPEMITGISGPADYETWYAQVYGPGIAHARFIGLDIADEPDDWGYARNKLYDDTPLERRIKAEMKALSRKRKGDFLGQSSANKK